MLKADIITVGKLKESYLRDACGEYLKRMGAYCKGSVIELPESRLPQEPSPSEIAACIQKEGQAILGRLPAQGYVIALCIEGEMITSPQLAQKLQQVQNQGVSQLAMVIGGSYGLAQEVKDRADFQFSMSRLTFPHQLARVMVLEQLYRALSINNHSKYHK